ncbi:MAG: GMC family oxidoreductase [Roseovarius sp.]
MTKFDFGDERVVVVIGSGAGGGTSAHALCTEGIDVVLLEAGPQIDADDFLQDEVAAYNMLAWQEPQEARGGWRVARDLPNNPTWICRAVGGTSIHWTATALRFQNHEFKCRSTYGAIEGSDLIDWPISCEEIAPYYERAEKVMGVSGKNGMPHHPTNNHYKVLHAGASAIGYKQITPGSLAVNSRPYDDRPASWQDGFTLQGDRSRAKWSTAYIEIPRALATGHLDLRSNCCATQIEHDATGRVSAVVYVDANGQRQRQKCSVVVVAGNAVQTPRLLLASTSAQFPDGLANGSGYVGRCYMRHTTGSTWSIFEKPVRMCRGEMMPGLVSDEAPHMPERGFAGGYYIQLLSLSLPAIAGAVDPGWWGKDYAWFVERHGNMAGLFLLGEDLPQFENRVTLSSDRVDRNDVPIPVVTYAEHPNDLAMQVHGYAQMKKIHEAAGAVCSHDTPPWPASHNMGTTRMSKDPAEGVLDAWGRAHEVENLFIADGSVFTTSAAANPTLTIVALAMRQSEEIVRQIRS